MLNNKFYKNGEKTQLLIGNKLTCFFKNRNWIRYDKNNQLEYNDEFVNDKRLLL